jgi:hypothetical protein
MPRARLPVALLSFNVGVEIGQLAVIALLVPLLAQMRARRALGTRGERFVSGALAATGVVWFVLRVAR